MQLGNMADGISHFAREVERLVTAPYVPSLQVCEATPETRHAVVLTRQISRIFTT